MLVSRPGLLRKRAKLKFGLNIGLFCNRRVWCDRMDASYHPALLYTLRSIDGPDFKGADDAAHSCRRAQRRFQ